MFDIVLGIDLGTTNSVASYWDGKMIHYIKNINNSYIFPSVIEFAKNKIIISEEGNIKNIKLLIGNNKNNLILNNLKNNNKIKEDEKTIYIYNNYEQKYYSLEELNYLILNNIRIKAENQLNKKIKDIVITIPAHFNQHQKESINKSIKLANLNCLRMITEPTASSLAYGLNIYNDINIFVIDIGGGTMDLSILNIDNGVFDVLATNGDNNFGGELFTNLILELIKTKTEYNNINYLYNQAEKLKKNLKQINYIKINNNNINNNNNNNNKFNFLEIKKKEIDDIFLKLFIKIKELIFKTLKLANLEINEIDNILLVGGFTKYNLLKVEIEKLFNKKINTNIDPDLIVSYGASIQGYILKNKFNLDITLLDITSFSIGVECNNGSFCRIIKKGQKIPCKNIKYFKLDNEKEETIDINIYQGENNKIKNNILLGKYNINKTKKTETTIIKIIIFVNINNMINIKIEEKGYNNKKVINYTYDNHVF